MTANGVPSCGNLRKRQRPRIAGPSLQTSALPLGYGAVASIVTKSRHFLNLSREPEIMAADMWVFLRVCRFPVPARVVDCRR